MLQNALKDGLNYGLYLPESNGRSGKFLDEERPLRDYPLSGSIALLEVSVIDFDSLTTTYLDASSVLRLMFLVIAAPHRVGRGLSQYVLSLFLCSFVKISILLLR